MSAPDQTSRPIVARWKSLPRSMRWALMAGAGIAVYFLVIEPALGEMAKWNVRAAKKEQDLTKFDQDRRERQDMDNAATVGVSRFGLIEPPGDASSRSETLNRKVAKVLEDNGIKRPTTTTRSVSLPNNSALSRQLGTDYRVERLVNDIVFDAEPEQIAKVIADLEKLPEISSISRVQIRQGSGDGDEARIVRATLAVETWRFEKKGRAK
jgi:hypothetical protein